MRLEKDDVRCLEIFLGIKLSLQQEPQKKMLQASSSEERLTAM